MKKKTTFLLLGVLGLFVSCVSNEAIISPNLGTITDGTYRGSSRLWPVSVDLDVTVQDNAITSIEIVRHFNGRGEPAEAIIPTIISAQSLDVDVIAGATQSSRAILKAVENALADSN